MSIDLVVVNYKTPDDLDRFLGSLDANPPTVVSTLTIVEVDSDEDYEHEFNWAGGRGLTIGVADNIGYARSCNLAVARRSGDVAALFNADIEVTPDSLDECYNALVSERSWGVLGPRQVDRQGRIRHAGIFGTLDAPVHRGWNEQDSGQYSDVRRAVTVSGSAYFVRRAVWDELTECALYRDVAPDAQGAFLPTAHYYEETFCSYHAQAHGYRVFYYGSVTMIHAWHRASPIGGWAEQQMDVSRDYFRAACEHHGIRHD